MFIGVELVSNALGEHKVMLNAVTTHKGALVRANKPRDLGLRRCVRTLVGNFGKLCIKWMRQKILTSLAPPIFGNRDTTFE